MKQGRCRRISLEGAKVASRNRCKMALCEQCPSSKPIMVNGKTSSFDTYHPFECITLINELIVET